MTKLIKIVDEIDVNPILESFYKLESYIQWTDYPTTKQTGLQYRNGNEPWSDGAGSGLKWPQYESGSSAYSSDNPNLNKTWYENISINPFFKETIFEEIINKYDMVRTRLIWVKPFSCYSFHKDTSPRLHFEYYNLFNIQYSLHYLSLLTTTTTTTTTNNNNNNNNTH